MLNTSKSEVPNAITTVRHIYFYNSVFQVLLPANLRFVVTKKVEWEDDAMHWTVEMREIGKTFDGWPEIDYDMTCVAFG